MTREAGLSGPSALARRWPGARPASHGSALPGLAAVGGGAILGLATVVSPQLGCAIALAGAVVLTFLASPRTGLLALWALWLVAPGIRRLFGLLGPYVAADPLAVAPFAATAVVAAIQIARTHLDRETQRVLVLAGAGLALGIPAGASSPEALAFGLAAYGGGVLAFVLGRTETPRWPEQLSLRRAMVVGAPLLAAYGIAQYFLPLTEWDSRWLASVDFASIGAPEPGKIRVFSTLNAPGVLAPVLTLALLCYLTVRRIRAQTIVAVALVTAALGLTYVRGAWIAFAAGALVLALLSRSRRAWALIAVCCIVIVAGLGAGGGSATTRAFTERIGTFGSLGTDTSATERRRASSALVPELLREPVGRGLGAAGEPARLRGDDALRAPDNGYLSLLYQLGPAGALLVLAAAAMPLAALVGHVRRVRARDPESVLLLSAAVTMLVLLFTGDLFYGVAGVTLWFVLGRGLHLARMSIPPPSGGT